MDCLNCGGVLKDQGRTKRGRFADTRPAVSLCFHLQTRGRKPRIKSRVITASLCQDCVAGIREHGHRPKLLWRGEALVGFGPRLAALVVEVLRTAPAL